MIPETREIECEPIYAADSLMLSQIKVFLIEILAQTEEWTQHGFPQKLLSFLLKQEEPKSCEWCLSILDQAPNSFDDVSTLIPLVTCQAPATSSLIDYKTLLSSSQGPQPLPLQLKQFQDNAEKSSLPKSAKLVALYLSLDHTGQSLSPGCTLLLLSPI
ncbi:hypothetical protein DSO57_1011052 [Entomophthora muscae]|uniref:Uncharacterized protein n=1 Tax=Entomophthora muscae TaxID=34485 RepID=A0ACC2RXF7_9FUNG|nr:hypothetical protein DSO57_1011052 [Entomophthora muscae]